MSKLIAVYGTSREVKRHLLDDVEFWLRMKKKCSMQRTKCPNYSLSPTGQALNDYIHRDPTSRSPMHGRDFQLLCFVNIAQVESRIIWPAIRDGRYVLAEDYVGANLAWGIEYGFTRSYLEFQANLLQQPDISFFVASPLEETSRITHIHENDKERMARVKKIFFDLAAEKKWWVIHTEDGIDVAAKEMKEILQRELKV